MAFNKSLLCYILKNKNFESKIKKLAVTAILNILKVDASVSDEDLAQTFCIFVDNVNNIGKYQDSEALFFFLVKSVSKQYIKLIFKDLLNLNQ
jgi:hypothetical protein